MTTAKFLQARTADVQIKTATFSTKYRGSFSVRARRRDHITPVIRSLNLLRSFSRPQFTV